MPVDILRVLTWNAGGLTKQVFQELETYARESGVDIFYIQETRLSDYNWSNMH